MTFRHAVLAAAAVLAALATFPAAAQEAPAAPDRTAVEKIVREYLMEHPEVVVEAIEEYKRRAEERERLAADQAVKARADELFRDPASPVGGNARGDVTIVEFFDYRCGVCKSVHPIVAELMKTDPGIRRVYKEWPILGPESIFAARAALAAHRQGRYLAFHDALMTARGALDPAAVFAIAGKAGIDIARLKKDMDAPEIEAAIRKNYELARALNLNGTPSFLIGDTVLRGARDLDTLRELVARARKAG